MNIADSPDERQNWINEIQLVELLRVPAVRELIAKHAAAATRPESAEEFLRSADTLQLAGMALIPGAPFTPLSNASIAGFLLPHSKAAGIQTGKTRTETLPHPPGAVIVAALCSLAGHSQTLRQTQQHSDGCCFEAVLPSDMWSWEGVLYVSIRRVEDGTFVEARTIIAGQLFDWGKSKRCLKTLFNDLRTLALDFRK